jgi:hypothetical protein
MITSTTAARFNGLTTVTVTSSLSAPVYYHWFVGGQHAATTRDVPEYTFRIPPGEQARIDCVDTNDADADPADLAPADQAPATRTLFWVRSLSADTDYYRVEQQTDGGDWELLGTVPHGAWSYEYRTGRLDDLTDYAWRVVPVDRAGNHGTPVATETEYVVRTPDAPSFTVAWSDVTGRVTYSEA